ncbi:MAG TPA: membrane or secreted protein [Cytophagales bacterium]|nr:membrane or secreted protein [Cytophagales bacterium]HAA22614.1 membrane or secreted protein [Cytophagales bacterium]HAP63559.1 membrane or secreted protein [Cytophagales bacterium]
MTALLFSLLVLLVNPSAPAETHPWEGGWLGETEDGEALMAIVTPGFFSITHYQKEPSGFGHVLGGSWKAVEDGRVEITYEFHSAKSEMVGTTEEWEWSQMADVFVIHDYAFEREDDGTPGALQGAWLITGRERNGELRMRTPGARKTMKILSGSLFQWIAYNTDTGEFLGTGGGHYTTEKGNYTENIEFFSRDASRVGASLEFRYSIREEAWQHSGLNSRGEPLFEIWEQRTMLGI